MRDFMTITKALSDENRVRILMALQDRELCVCQIIEFLELAPSTVSKHLSILSNARLIESRKEGRWVYYRLADKDIPAILGGALCWVQGSLRKDRQVLEDNNRLKEIMKVNPEKLCKQQSQS